MIIDRSYSKVSFRNILGNPSDNTSLSTILNQKTDKEDSSANNYIAKFNSSGNPVKTNITEDSLNKLVSNLILPNAGSHNSFYRGKDITSYWQDKSLESRISGTGYELFEDLFVGDYFNAGTYSNLFGNTNPTTYYFAIAGFDLKYKVGRTPVNQHTITLVPCSSDGNELRSICSSKMYDSTSFTTGYSGSIVSIECKQTGSIGTGLATIFDDILVNSYNLRSTKNTTSDYYNRTGGTKNGSASDYDWEQTPAMLMSEIELYGSIVWSSSGYSDPMGARGQLPIFRLRPDFMSSRGYDFWLRDLACAGNFCFAGAYGAAYHTTATTSKHVTVRFEIS